MTLFELMAVPLEDVALIPDLPDQVKENYAIVDTIPRLHQDNITLVGANRWADVLNAQVSGIHEGVWGTHIDLKGVSVEKLEAFVWAIIGYCDREGFDLWFKNLKGVTCHEHRAHHCT